MGGGGGKGWALTADWKVGRQERWQGGSSERGPCEWFRCKRIKHIYFALDLYICVRVIFYEPCRTHVVFIPGIRFSILNELTFQVTWLQMMRHPLHLLCRSCGLIPDMHLPNYYETGWINLLDVESSPLKYCPWWPVSIYQVGVTSACYVYQKIVILRILHMNFWWFRTRILHTPTTTFSFNWILVDLLDLFYSHKIF